MNRSLTTILIVALAVGTIAGFTGSVAAQEQTVTQDASNAAEQSAEVTNGSAILTVDQDASNLAGQTLTSEDGADDGDARQVVDQDASNMGVQTASVMDGETVELSIAQDASNSAEQSG